MAQHDPLNLKVHHKNPKSGKTERITPYRLHFEGRIRFFEKPAGSGVFFYENGDKVPSDLCPKLTKLEVRLSDEELREKHNQLLGELSSENETLKAKLAAIEGSKSAPNVIINKSK